MKRNALYIFLILLLATALTALAQSPTSSNMGGSETKDPYGATLDHPNPGSTMPGPGQAATEPNVPAATAPAATPATTPSTTSTTTSTTVDNTSGTPTSTTDTSGTAPDTSTTAGGKLPRTASDLPLLVTIGLLALGGALTVRSFAKRNT
ncbi:MAG TPA: hypothetical protein VHB47_07025 [Thermoanaerobaculia bacterium]|jgi:cytoskeletal protein RodZ|nr:hypothetical protein [Thermoanaerobaculia bacterium]